MHYRRAGHRAYHTRGDGILAGRTIKRIPPPPAQELGRLGGEMARRMVDAALAYLTERAVTETRAAFVETAYGAGNNGRAVTTNGRKA